MKKKNPNRLLVDEASNDDNSVVALNLAYARDDVTVITPWNCRVRLRGVAVAVAGERVLDAGAARGRGRALPERRLARVHVRRAMLRSRVQGEEMGVSEPGDLFTSTRPSCRPASRSPPPM